jgi:hypothetical protein
MRLAVEPELEMLRDALSARALTSVRPLAVQVDRGRAFDVAQSGAEIQQIIINRELLKRNGS